MDVEDIQHHVLYNFNILWKVVKVHTLIKEIVAERDRIGLSQAELAKRAGVDRTTIVKLEAGKGANLNTVSRVLGVLDLELHARPAELPRRRESLRPGFGKKGAPVSKSKAWGLSFPYDWANPNLHDEALIAAVLKGARLTDVARVCYKVGLDKVDKVLAERVTDPYEADEARRVLKSVRKGFERAEEGIPASAYA